MKSADLEELMQLREPQFRVSGVVQPSSESPSSGYWLRWKTSDLYEILTCLRHLIV